MESDALQTTAPPPSSCQHLGNVYLNGEEFLPAQVAVAVAVQQVEPPPPPTAAEGHQQQHESRKKTCDMCWCDHAEIVCTRPESC